MRRGIITGLAIVAGLAACASKKQPENVSLSPQVTLEIVNNFSPPVQITAFILSSSGGRRTLGTVSPGRTQQFPYSPTNASDKFTFIAQATGGRTASSQTFTLINVMTATWDLQSNLVRFQESSP